MDRDQVRKVRSFNRTVTQTVGALDESYLRRGRPLGEARLLFEVGLEGAEVKALRETLGLDSGYMSRLLRSLTAAIGWVASSRGANDAAIQSREARYVPLYCFALLAMTAAEKTQNPKNSRRRASS